MRNPALLRSARRGRQLAWLAPVLVATLGVVVELDAARRLRADAAACAASLGETYAAQLAVRLHAGVAAASALGAVAAEGGNAAVDEAGLRRALLAGRELEAAAVWDGSGRLAWASDPAIAQAGTSPVLRLPDPPGAVAGPTRQVLPDGRDVLPVELPVTGTPAVARVLAWLRLPWPPGGTDIVPGSDGWRFTVVDARTHHVLGSWRDGAWHEPGEERGDADGGALSAVPGFPFEVRTTWPADRVARLWAASGPARWVTEAVALGGVLALIALMRRRNRRCEAIENAMHRARMVDELTGLPSRQAFEEGLFELILRLHGDEQLAVLVVDVYRFARVNERWGRDAGDDVLRQLAARLRGLNAAARMARVGPDSFALAFLNVTGEQLGALIESVLSVLHAPLQMGDDHDMRLSASIGCALYPRDTQSPAALLGSAEAAVFGQSARNAQGLRARLDPYGSEAGERLAWAQRFTLSRLAQLGQGYLEALQHESGNPDLRTLLTGTDSHGSERAFAHRVAGLFAPRLSREQHRDAARRVGRMHTALGVPRRAAIAASSRLCQDFIAFSYRIPGRLHDRAVLLGIVWNRLEAELTHQQLGADEVRDAWRRAVTTLALGMPAMRSRIDVLDLLVEQLQGMPFMVFCAVYGRDDTGNLLVEAESREHQAWFADHPQLRMAALAVDAPVARAWATASLQQGGGPDPADPAVRPLHAAGVRTSAAMPVLDGEGRVIAVVAAYGALAGMFDTQDLRDAIQLSCVLGSRALRAAAAGAVTTVPARERAIWRRRLQGGGLHMYMQPIVDFARGACTRVEALARLHLDDGSIVTPGHFLPGLGQPELDQLFVAGLHQSLEALRRWERDGAVLDLAFNLPPMTLRNPDCVAWVASALERHRIDPARLTLEVLESQDFSDENAVLAVIDHLKALGVRLALDDLGSGFSSLLRLRNLPFDMVKIDQGLVRGIPYENRRSAPMVAGLVELARRLNVQVTIEGLETQILIEFAQSLGADYGQGFGIARPMPASQIPAWIRGWRMAPFSGINPFAGV